MKAIMLTLALAITVPFAAAGNLWDSEYSPEVPTIEDSTGIESRLPDVAYKPTGDIEPTNDPTVHEAFFWNDLEGDEVAGFLWECRHEGCDYD